MNNVIESYLVKIGAKIDIGEYKKNMAEFKKSISQDLSTIEQKQSTKEEKERIQELKHSKAFENNIIKERLKSVKNALQETTKLKKEEEKQQKQEENNRLKQAQQLEQTEKGIARNIAQSSSSGLNLSSAFSLIGGKAALILSALMAVYETMKKITDSATEFSNQMITANSAFVNAETRNLMAQFGVSSQTATGLSSVMGLMGISSSDLKYMTPAQLTLFSKLMDTWTNGINSIDSEKLDYYNEVLQNFQSEFATERLKLEIEFYKLLVGIAPELETLFDDIIDVMKNVESFLSSNIVQTALKALVNVVDALVKIISSVTSLFNWLPSSSATTSTISSTSSINYTTIDASSENTFTGSTNSMYDLSSNISNQKINSIYTAYLNSGRA